ncbi:MAG: hypothetical protein ACREX0_04500 [Noviherbaspirillum sp.]
MYSAKNRLMMLVPATALSACTVMPPNEPSVMVLPGTGKSFEQFRADNEICKQFAYSQVAGRSPESSAIDSGVRSAALGTILGAAAGAAIDGGRGASVGAGAGLALGGLSGTAAAETSAYRLQQRYDIGYQQCMYAKGHRIPMSGGLMSDFFRGYRERASVTPPPPPGRILR